MRPFYLLSVVSLLLPQAGAWLLPFVASSDQVADFGLALRFSLLFGLPFFISSRVYIPRIAKAASEGRLGDLEHQIVRAATAASAVTALGLIGFLFLGNWLTSLAFGDDFRGSFWPTVVLAVGALVNSASGLSMAVLSNSGEAGLVSKASTVAGLAFVLGSLGLGSSLGATGVAIAALASQLVLNVAMTRKAANLTGIRSWISYSRMSYR